MSYDVFISHANEDKDNVARPLAVALTKRGIHVWLDEFELTLGDSLRRKIDEGLQLSRYGIVILSEAFFAKDWPERELNALVSREKKNSKVVLPVWHGVSRDHIATFSPILADKFAVGTQDGIAPVVDAVLAVLRHDPQHLATGEIQYLDCNASADTSSVSVSLKATEKSKKLPKKKVEQIVEPLWDSAMKLVSILSGWPSQEIIIGHPRIIGYANHVIERSLDGLQNIGIKEWQSFSVMIHIRGYQTLRDIENGYFDFYFMPSSDPYGIEYAPIRKKPDVVKRLISMKRRLKPQFEAIAAITVQSHVQLSMQDPFWSEDCVPIWGGDAYWMKCMITEQGT